MKNQNSSSRRRFLKTSAGAAAAGVGLSLMRSVHAEGSGKIKVAVVGTGGRGTSLLSNLLQIDDAEIVAVCDLFKERAERAAAICKERRGQEPKTYFGSETVYKELLDNEKLDAIIIATYWEYHTPIAVAALYKKIYTAIEVPAALSVDECWQLVELSEKNHVGCMMLENWSFRRDNLAVLNMIREGLFGEIVHSHCAHSHDCIDHWFFDGNGNDKWPAKYLVNYNRDQYPTHSVGPVLSWLDINCGDVFTEIYSTASASKGINAYMKRKFGENHPNANRKFAQGDIVTSTLKTAKGKTLVINYDMQLPRPYSNRWLVQGTLGVYDEEKASIYLTGKSPQYHQWEAWKPYEEKYLHKWWKPDEKMNAGGHGGVDFLELREFINAVRDKGSTPLDVYDSVVMSAIVELSGLSIEQNKPVAFPDFTKGKWKEKKPYFGV